MTLFSQVPTTNITPLDPMPIESPVFLSALGMTILALTSTYWRLVPSGIGIESSDDVRTSHERCPSGVA